MKQYSNFEEGVQWYCIRSKPKKEKVVANTLQARFGFDVFNPQIRFKRKTKVGIKWFQEAMFPGYVFAKFDLFEQKRAVCGTPGVLTIPTFNSRYISIPESVLISIGESMNEEDVAEATSTLNEGDEATVLAGSMQGVTVKVIRLVSASERVAVLMEMMGTLVEVEMDKDILEQKPDLSD